MTAAAARAAPAHRRSASQAPVRIALDSPVGRLVLAGDEGALTHVLLPESGASLDPTLRARGAVLAAGRQLEAYFSGRLRSFDLVLATSGTPFQTEVWSALCTIPYGTTISYADLAGMVGRPGAARAVGQANGANPLAIVVPCHRVVAADGSLGGYGGGLAIKRALLTFESGAP